MNKVITDGLVLMPPPFSAGLGVWSSGDGTPGSDTYAISGSGSYVPADQDFAGCLEIVKTNTVQKLRYMGETTILPGCYIRVTARVKAVAGPPTSNSFARVRRVASCWRRTGLRSTCATASSTARATAASPPTARGVRAC